MLLDVSRIMNANGTYSVDVTRDELVYVALSLLISTLCALLASFLGLRRRHESGTASTSLHGTGGRSYGERKDVLRV